MLLPPRATLCVTRLGQCSYDSPLPLPAGGFIDEEDRVLVSTQTKTIAEYSTRPCELPSFERGGPRRCLYFDPRATICGIVTCGGLCPGLNDVIRSITLSALHTYGVKQVLGFRYGYAGITSAGQKPFNLTEEMVDGIIGEAGTILGSSRGPQDPAEMVDTLERLGVNILFTVGGDGTLRGASKIAAEVARRNLPIAVIGVPKTIDNDILWTSTSFGFYTAVEQAKNVIHAAHAEAKGAENGIGLVKLMGRDSGFIAAHAARASSVVNFCLIPEISLRLEGEDGLLPLLEKRLLRKKHAVIVVSEGAGQALFEGKGLGKDASGNTRFGDIGLLLKEEIERYLKERKLPFSLKYLDPSYSIRSAPTDTIDAEFCLILGQYAVHAGMAGCTDAIVGMWNQGIVHVPIPVVTEQRKRINVADQGWQIVLDITNQPRSWNAAPAA